MAVKGSALYFLILETRSKGVVNFKGLRSHLQGVPASASTPDPRRRGILPPLFIPQTGIIVLYMQSSSSTKKKKKKPLCK